MAKLTWRIQNAAAGRAKRFELRDTEAFKAVLSVRTTKPMTLEEMQELVRKT